MAHTSATKARIAKARRKPRLSRMKSSTASISGKVSGDDGRPGPRTDSSSAMRAERSTRNDTSPRRERGKTLSLARASGSWGPVRQFLEVQVEVSDGLERPRFRAGDRGAERDAQVGPVEELQDDAAGQIDQ